MAVTPIEKRASDEESQQMLTILEKIGRTLQPEEVKKVFQSIPKNVRTSENLARFLLLVAILDQQAESPSARATAAEIYGIFGEDLFKNPLKVMANLDKLWSIRDKYRISPAIGRVLPRFGWLVLRVGGFLIYELMLNKRTLVTEFKKCRNPKEAIEFLYRSHVLESILREKAARMYISWIGHPELGIDISAGLWKKIDFKMPVDGHVGKVFCRAGLLPIVVHESKKTSDKRWNIIIASEMREPVEGVVKKFKLDPIMVDHGAFQLGIHCCPDDPTKIACDICRRSETCEIKTPIDCRGRCPLSTLCKRNVIWRAY